MSSGMAFNASHLADDVTDEVRFAQILRNLENIESRIAQSFDLDPDLTDNTGETEGSGTNVATADSNVGNGTTTSPVRLRNDQTNPGNNRVYGTDENGVKGYKDDPASGGAATFSDYDVREFTTSSTTLSLAIDADAGFSGSWQGIMTNTGSLNEEFFWINFHGWNDSGTYRWSAHEMRLVTLSSGPPSMRKQSIGGGNKLLTTSFQVIASGTSSYFLEFRRVSTTALELRARYASGSHPVSITAVAGG